MKGEVTVDVLVPTAYSFPSAGTLLGLAFILFAAWFVGTPLDFSQYPVFTVMGALTAFGSMAVAIPFLLNYFNFPVDLFQLYLLGSVVTARFATALAVLHGVVICLLGAIRNSRETEMAFTVSRTGYKFCGYWYLDDGVGCSANENHSV